MGAAPPLSAAAADDRPASISAVTSIHVGQHQLATIMIAEKSAAIDAGGRALGPSTELVAKRHLFTSS